MKKIASWILIIAVIVESLGLNLGEIKVKAGESSIKQGDIITFGHYEQDNDLTNGAEPIEWMVLDVEDDKALLLSKYAVDCKPYNEVNEAITWENCTLRKWMNNDFYNSAFTDEEKKWINITHLENKDNATFGTDGGNDTNDKVFLLSADDLVNPKYGFSEDKDDYNDVNRRCPVTDYAKENGAWTSKIFVDKGLGNERDYTKEGEYWCLWWMRSPGANETAAVFAGCICQHLGLSVDDLYECVRPALYFNLNSFNSTNLANKSDREKNSESTVSVKKGGIITFGHYEQDNDSLNGTEPIEWIVLTVEEDKALLLSKYVLNNMKYNEEQCDITWENSTLRKWLNEDFYDASFTEAEKEKIVEITNSNNGNPVYETNGGNNTIDKVFLPSWDDVTNEKNGFDPDYEKWTITRRCAPTVYAVSQGAFEESFAKTSEGKDSCDWWIRTSGGKADYVAFVENGGELNEYGANAYYAIYAYRYGEHGVGYDFYSDRGSLGVRPAIWIDLDKYYNSLYSDENITAIEEPAFTYVPEQLQQPITKPDITLTAKPTKEPDVTSSPGITQETVTSEPIEEDRIPTPTPTEWSNIEQALTQIPIPMPTPSTILDTEQTQGFTSDESQASTLTLTPSVSPMVTQSNEQEDVQKESLETTKKEKNDEKKNKGEAMWERSLYIKDLDMQ